MTDIPALPERKVPVIVKPDYTVFLERTSGLTFVHCEVTGRWSPTVKENLRRDWAAFRSLHQAPILALHTPGDRKHHKFLTMFGFEIAGSFEDAATLAETHLFIHSGA